MYYYIEKQDLSSAEDVLVKLKNNFPESESAVSAMSFMENNFPNGNNKLGKSAANSSNEKSENIPKEYELVGNYPNPFNPKTNIKYGLPSNSRVELTIYNINGRKIKSYLMDSQSQGYHTITWDGRNEHGNKVASGIYLYKIKAISLEENKNFVKSAKLMLLK